MAQESNGKTTFATVYPKGIQLSNDVHQFLEKRREEKRAVTFDEITLEDKPSDFHPNDVSLHTFVTRKVALKVMKNKQE